MPLGNLGLFAPRGGGERGPCTHRTPARPARALMPCLNTSLWAKDANSERQGPGARTPEKPAPQGLDPFYSPIAAMYSCRTGALVANRR